MLVPYSKYQLVACPFGVTVPFSFADVGATELAAPVTAVGAADRREGLVRASARSGVAGRDEAVVVEPAARRGREHRRETTPVVLVPEPALFSAVFEP